MSKQRERHEIFIPSETIVEEQPRQMPFAYLRTWIVGVLALLLIPVGITLLLVGQIRDEQLRQDWVETQAEIVEVANGRLVYEWTASGTQQQDTISLDWLSDTRASVEGPVNITLDLCTIGVRTILPNEPGDMLTIWYNPESPKQNDCLPVSEESTMIYIILGASALLFSFVFLLRIFSRAASQTVATRGS